MQVDGHIKTSVVGEKRGPSSPPVVHRSSRWEMPGEEPRASAQRCSAKGLGQPPAAASVPRGLGARAGAFPFSELRGRERPEFTCTALVF